jgi:hypothetical protein
MAKKGKKNFSIKRVGEIMEDLDTPHGDFDLGLQFQKNGAVAPPGPKPTQALLDAFQNTFEPVSSEHLAQELFSAGRLREYFQAWIIPKMPDPLPAYIQELSCMGFPMRTSFDGTACIMVRHRVATEVKAEEVEEENRFTDYLPEDIPVYTDDWKDDLSDLPPYEEK